MSLAVPIVSMTRAWFMVIFVLSSSTYAISDTAVNDALQGFGVPMEINFHRAEPRPLTCDASNFSKTSTYSWFVEGGEPLDVWINSSGVNWKIQKFSENNNELVLWADSVSLVDSVLLYCLRDEQAIVNMTLLVRRENNLLYGENHRKGVCNITSNYVTVLSCNGSTWQHLVFCDWLFMDQSRYSWQSIQTGALTYLVLRPEVHKPGLYKCKCRIDQKLKPVREFEVGVGEPRNSFFCLHLRESQDISTAPADMKITPEIVVNIQKQSASISTNHHKEWYSTSALLSGFIPVVVALIVIPVAVYVIWKRKCRGDQRLRPGRNEDSGSYEQCNT